MAGHPAYQKNDKASLFVANSYLENICESDVSTVDGIKKDPKKVRALLKSYARNIATSASNMTVLKDINANYDDMVESTLYSYLDALNRILSLMIFLHGALPFALRLPLGAETKNYLSIHQ